MMCFDSRVLKGMEDESCKPIEEGMNVSLFVWVVKGQRTRCSRIG
jgi:hypothetical protein